MFGLLFDSTPAWPQSIWIKIGDVANPPALETHAAVYDSLRDRLLAYNPYSIADDAMVAASGMWEFRLSQPDSGWRQLGTTGAAPLGMRQSSMVLDQPNQRVLLFAGIALEGVPTTNDLYQLSLAGTPT